jgi:hypothetical protein
MLFLALPFQGKPYFVGVPGVGAELRANPGLAVLRNAFARKGLVDQRVLALPSQGCRTHVPATQVCGLFGARASQPATSGNGAALFSGPSLSKRCLRAPA